MHGPYPNIPAAMLKKYLGDRATLGFPDDQTEAEFIRDRESEWQADQHEEALLEAFGAGRLTDKEFAWLQDNIRPWFIGWRNPGEYEVE